MSLLGEILKMTLDRAKVKVEQIASDNDDIFDDLVAEMRKQRVNLSRDLITVNELLRHDKIMKSKKELPKYGEALNKITDYTEKLDALIPLANEIIKRKKEKKEVDERLQNALTGPQTSVGYKGTGGMKKPRITLRKQDRNERLNASILFYNLLDMTDEGKPMTDKEKQNKRIQILRHISNDELANLYTHVYPMVSNPDNEAGRNFAELKSVINDEMDRREFDGTMDIEDFVVPELDKKTAGMMDDFEDESQALARPKAPAKPKSAIAKSRTTGDETAKQKILEELREKKDAKDEAELLAKMFSGEGKKKVVIQAVIFNKDADLKSADRLKILHKLKLKPIKRVHVTENWQRYRITEPKGRRVNTRHIKVNDVMSFIMEFPK